MKWPRGKYNGRKIGGFRLEFEFNIAWWTWYVRLSKHSKTIHIGCFHWWIETAYEVRYK